MSALAEIDVDALIPDSIEPVEEWRTWKYHPTTQSLVSHNGTPWTPGKALEAFCGCGGERRVWALVRDGMSRAQAQEHANYQNQMNAFSISMGRPMPGQIQIPRVDPPPHYGYALVFDRHKCPDPGCTCGIYAGSNLGICPPGEVMGKVKMWGTVIPGEKGSRAQFAYPSEFYVETKLMDDPGLLAFGVPIKDVAELSERPAPSGLKLKVNISAGTTGGMLISDGSIQMKKNRTSKWLWKPWG